MISRIGKFLRFLTLFLFITTIFNVDRVISVSAGTGTGEEIFLPLVTGGNALQSPVRRVNMPNFGSEQTMTHFDEMAIFWYGKVRPDITYTDVRIGYNNTGITIHFGVIDRLLWSDDTPAPADLLSWDSVSVSINTSGPVGTTPGTQSFRFDAQMSTYLPIEDRLPYQASYRGNGAAWIQTSSPFSTLDNPYYGIYINDLYNDKGWMVTIEIPFSSLGLTGRPAEGQLWGLGVATYNRNNQSGMPIGITNWPENYSSTKPSTWGTLYFGTPGYTSPPSGQTHEVEIKHGIGGAVVKDADVGGRSVCGGSLDYWEEWGDTSYPGENQVTIQNQANIDDYPCFSKYYITFPLDQVPAGKVIKSASLTMNLFGNSLPSEAEYSQIHVMTIKEDWNESTLTWNNAPLAFENVSRQRVDPVPNPSGYSGWPGIPYTWDLSRAVSEAYSKGEALQLVLYSADWPMHSGKYFFSSDEDVAARPSLIVTWGDP